nr:PREDICTED: keratin, type I cytoskeletal 17-like [Stegastes partitus]
MSQWQLLRASRANQAALGYRVQHGAAAPVYYSTAVAAAGGNCGRSFCLSSEKQTLQQLNGRLASYLQQVQCLEAANQRLECQIQEELNRKCPGELRQLDGYLRRASLLQDKISECLSDQAQVKLQLLGAQLDAFDLNARCEKECERRGRVEAELSDLRELDAELKIYKMPELESLLDNQMQQLDVQVLVGQVSGGIAVEMQTAESSDLLRQLKHLRTTSVPLLDRNPKEYWFKTQVSTLSSPEVTFDPAVGSDLDQAEVKELRRTATTLTEELTRLQALILVLEVSGREQADSFVLQLEALQQKVDGLCRDLDSVLQAAAQQAADYDALLDIKSRLEAEIQDYKRLLDEINQEKYEMMMETQ